MSRCVPGERPYSPVFTHSKISKRATEVASALRPLSVIASLDPCRCSGNQFLMRKKAFRSSKEEIKSERGIHHCRLHVSNLGDDLAHNHIRVG